MIFINNNQNKLKTIYKLIIEKFCNRCINQEFINSNEILSNVNGISLDVEQRIAIITDASANLVIAGAGSGKSLTIVGKIRYLIELKDIKVDEILCITFTKAAAINLENSIKKNYNYNIKVYTFHSLAFELLKEYNFKISNSNLLNYIVDEYFYSIIKNNNNMIVKLKKILGKNDMSYEDLLESNELYALKKLIITFINLFKTNNYNLKYFLKFHHNKNLISIIIDIYYLYEEELKSTNSIDFNDMIKLASIYVDTHFIKKYKYIIVDEYQDTSYIRYLLIKKIIKKTGAKIMCVGDDYQSIYRFSGCDIGMFLNFKNYFKGAKILKLCNTYRNSQELINVAGGFIMKNNRQIYKNLKSNKSLLKPIKIKYGSDLKNLIDVVSNKYQNILILGRNKFDIKKFNLNYQDFTKYSETKVRYMTIHSSKGLEEDCVIVINLSDGVLGMPNKIKNNNILKYVNNNKDIFPFEEERRLFYVALTRTKNEVYLLVDKKNPSIFVKELIKNFSKYIEYI